MREHNRMRMTSAVGLATLGVSAALLASPAAALAATAAPAQAAEAVSLHAATRADAGWVRSGDSWSYLGADGEPIRGWLVTDVLPGESDPTGLQRYWLKDDGTLAAGELVQSGESSWAYARPEGYVVRGAWADPATGNVYLANNDGLLASPGWVVSDAYGHGLQRYYVDPDAHACVPGVSGLGWLHYTTADGYVLRGTASTEHGTLIADNDGLLATAAVDPALVDAEGWYVGDLGQGLQRYAFNVVDGALYFRTGLFAATIGGAPAEFYGAPDGGYVVRNATAASPVSVNGRSYSSDNEGRLTELSSGGAERPGIDSPRERDPYIATVTWGDDAAYIERLAEVAAEVGSDTDYFISFDNELCRVIVFERAGAGWVATHLWNCHGARKTYSAANQHLYGWGGVYKISEHQICAWDDSYFGIGYNDWASCFIEYYETSNVTGHSRYVEGKGWENCASIHASAYDYTGNTNSGCCGLAYDNAKWVHDVVPLGTTVIEFDYSDGTYF